MCLTGALLAAAVAAAQIGVSPPHLDITIGKGPATGSLRIFNLGDQPVEVRTTVYNWDLDEHNKVRILPPNEQSLDQWMILNPVHFTIPPGRSQVVRFAVRPRAEPAPGEHRAIVYFEELEPHTVTRGKSTFKVRFRMGVAVYGHVGPVIRKGILHSVRVTGGRVLFDITNTGNANLRLAGQFAVWKADVYPGAPKTARIPALGQKDEKLPAGIVSAGFLPTLPVLPGARRTIELKLPKLDPGGYVLDLNGRLAEVPIDRGLPFTVSRPTPTPRAEPTPAAKAQPPAR